MIIKSLTALALAALPAIATADDTPIPAWCCPTGCETADDNAVLLPRRDDPGAYDLILNGIRVPVMPGAFQGSSANSPMRYCIGYDAFGDRQVKCLFVPAII